MELLDRYLQAVRKHLPSERQDDIVAELRANLEAQLEEKEGTLGRPLTPPEAEEWIRQLGSPIHMASHYQPQQYLIGPTLFPIYRHILKIALIWAIIVYAIGTIAKFFAASQFSGTALLDALFHTPSLVLDVAAWCTLTFAVVEYAVMQGWIKLPQLEPLSTAWAPGVLPPLEQPIPGKKQRSFAQAAIELAFGFLLLVWLLLIPRNPWLLMGPGVAFLYASPYQLAPVWWQFYWAIVALNIVQWGWNAENLWQGRWRQPQPVKQIAFKVMGLIPLVFVLAARDHVLIVLKHPALDQARYGATLDSINFYTYRGFLIVAAITTIQLIWELYQLSRNAFRNHAAAM
jgi:hypothetical protein